VRRTGKIGWPQLRARLAAAPGMAIAGVFIGVSGMMSVTYGYRLGEPSGNALIFAALAMAIEGFADLSVPMFWGRLRLIGRIVLLAFFVLCLSYKLEAAKRFAAENIGKHEVAAATAAAGYEIALQGVERLRKAVADNADARPAAVIQSEIDGLLRDPKAQGCSGAINGEVTKKICPLVDALRGELARAKARDQAQAELTPALTGLRNMAPVAAVSEVTPGPVAALLALAGIQVGSWSKMVASLIMAIVESGAIVVPLLIGFAFGEGRGREMTPAPQAQLERAPMAEEASPKSSLRRVTERGERDAAELTAFLGQRTERGAGEKVQSTTLYLTYSDWKQELGGEPMTINQFGTVLTQHLGLSKTKIDGKMHYLNLRLKAPVTRGKAARHLRSVAGVAS
jgi:hypothetical protein